MKIAASHEIFAIERKAEEAGVTGIMLMEHAAAALRRHCLDVLESSNNRTVVVLAGRGNNGGDGAALARLLYMSGVNVTVIFPWDTGNDKVSCNLETQLNILKNLPVRLVDIRCNDFIGEARSILQPAGLIVDALFGVGLTRPAAGAYADLIEAANAAGKYMISVDIPSGVCADTGFIGGAAIRADKTVAFMYPKIGLVLYPGAEYAGEVVTEDIGIAKIGENFQFTAESLTPEAINALIPVRRKDSNKGNHGKVCVFAGCAEMPGAMYLSCAAAYRAGAGLVRACLVKQTASFLHTMLPEAVTSILPDDGGCFCNESAQAAAGALSGANVVLMGPGIGRAAGVSGFVKHVLMNADCPVVLDADGLNAIADAPDILLKSKKPCVITPHPGEMGRLTGRSAADVLSDTLGTARAFSNKYNVITVLKTARTVIATPGGSAYINQTGNPALAKAGTGDALAGVIAGFMAQGLDARTAAALGAYIHGEAGDAAARDYGVHGVLAGDLLKYIPVVMKKYAGASNA